MELPQPTETAGNTAPEQGAAPQPEVRGKRIAGPAPLSPQSTQPSTLQPDPTQTQAPAAAAGQPGSDHTAALMADDADLIEKEWVTKAKAIVMQTKDDPHQQNREMNKVKADYLKKRYNKDLKVSES